VLGGIGPDAKAAIPVLADAMKHEPDVIRQRLAGILSQIDPAQFAGNTTTGATARAQLDVDSGQDELTSGVTDWPGFHGPHRRSVSTERGLLKEWPENGPGLLWTIEGLGRGLSNISIVGGRLFTMGDRPIDGEAQGQFVIAYDLQTREEIWATEIGEPFENGPRCTPTVDGDLVYALGTDGRLVCLEIATGNVRWQRNLVDDFDGKIMSIWKYSESPLIDGDRLICTPGGKETALVALDKHTGQLTWKCAVPLLGEKGADGAAYSSAVVAELAGVRQYVQLLGRGVVGVEAETGRFLWGYNRIANNVANITTPTVQGNYVFVSTAYSTGSALLEIVADGDQYRVEEVYFIGPRDFQNHHGGVVLVDGHIYGGHRPNRGDPTCIDASTGEVCWTERAPASGSAGVLYADGHLVFRYDRGDVVLIEATPKEYRIKGQFTAITNEGPAWAHPVIHQGKLYLRHADVLACYDLRAYE
jgi:outer membrane protein assembly factor BamB